MPTLQVEKAHLQTETLSGVMHLREKEFNYYEKHLSSIETIATLMAGFAFAALLLESQTISFDTVLFKDFTAELYFSFGVQWSEVISITVCFGFMLHVLQHGLVAQLLGYRLALRGGDGSINKATVQMARALRECVYTLAHGMQWFMLSILLHSVRVLHPCISFSVFVILFLLMWSTRTSIGRITENLHLAHSEEVHLADLSVAPQRSFRRGPGNFLQHFVHSASRGALALAWEDLGLMGDQASEGGARSVAERLIRTQQRSQLPPSPPVVRTQPSDIESAEQLPSAYPAPATYPVFQQGQPAAGRRAASPKSGGILSFFWRAI
jgi:hypothetical protein